MKGNPENDRPPVIDSSASHLTGQDSRAEETFLAMLVERGFPPPDEDQYKINLGGSSYTVADYAYTDAKVAIYIDGLSKNLHGDLANKVRDRRLRAVLIEKRVETIGDIRSGFEGYRAVQCFP